MEKTPAASAGDWSLRLEKSLRRQKSGDSIHTCKQIEALEEIGRRIERWNSEPDLSYAEYRMFGLIPGEDRLFLNKIFLNLADAFRFGSKEIKIGVVKVFLRMYRRKKGGGEDILSKGKLVNYLELLSRVKEVFDKGDVGERAMALRLFGCWSEFANDCADVRYIVLSSLVSGDVREVKAALFAASCFSELSDDFGNVFLEILTTIVLSREVSKDIKLVGARVFAKMWRPFSLADKAYKTGLKLLMGSCEDEDDFSVEMLISLSGIASRWMLLIPTQIELLALFQSEERRLHMQVTSLRCLRLIFERGVCNFPSTTGTINKLFVVLHRSECQPILQLEAFRSLHKILLFNLSIMPRAGIPELLLELLVVVKNMLQSSLVSTRVLAVSVLSDVSGKVLGRVDMVSGGIDLALALQVISFVLDQILLLVTQKADSHQADAVELEVKSLLNTLFNLVEKHSYLNCLVLNNISLFIDKLMKMLDNTMDTEKTESSNHEVLEFCSNGPAPFESKLMLYVSKVVVACLQNLEDIDAETSKVLDVLKLQAEYVCHCNRFDSFTCITYFLLTHLLSTFMCMHRMVGGSITLSRNLSLPCVDPVLQLDKLTLDCAKKMLGRRNNYWCSYKAGKTAACQGAWSTAAIIFEQLIAAVQSDSCSCWLKSLAQFSTSEKNIQLFLLSEESISIVPCESNLGERGGIALRDNYHSYIHNLLGAGNSLVSAEEILAASDTGHIFSFQRWFLTLRAKTLKSAVDMMKLLDTISFTQDSKGPGGQLELGTLLPNVKSQALGPLIYSSMEISCRMNKIARELDLLLTSFMGMDRQSVMSVSVLALSCSLMAFTAGFAFLVPSLYCSENYGTTKFGNSGVPFHAFLIDDLVGRLRHIDCETRKKLIFLLKSFNIYKECLSPRFQNGMSYTFHEATVLHKLCEYSVGEIFNLQNEATRLQRDGDAVPIIRNVGSQLLLNLISKLMLIPFRTPGRFFRVRPAVSSELFVMNEDGQIINGSSISSGSHLSLTLSFQLKNMPAGFPSAPTKVYCILTCKAHSQITTKNEECKWQARLAKKDQEINDMMDLNEMLVRHITVSSVDSPGLHRRGQFNDPLTASEYVCFELNERGKGFSTCLLDVSSFPTGSYRIKWHSGYIDSGGCYWSLLPVNTGPLFTIGNVTTVQYIC